jgi:cytochrome b6-f complex iron-sulfur subunit
MMTRKEFILRLPILTTAPLLASVVSSCSASGATVRTSSVDGTVSIPALSLDGIDEPGEYARVYVNGETNPIYMFRRSNGSPAAVSGTCSHKGCTVRKTRNGFECPCHGSEYDLEGHVTRGPASEALRSFPVQEREGVMMFQVPEGHQ